MTETDATDAIVKRFLAAWDVTATPVALDNEAFDPPTGASWVRLSVRLQTSQQHTLARAGQRRFRRTGAIFVQCFAKADAGSRAAMEFGESVRAIFEGQMFDGIDCRATLLRTIGNDRSWFNVNAETPFDFDEVR